MSSFTLRLSGSTSLLPMELSSRPRRLAQSTACSPTPRVQSPASTSIPRPRSSTTRARIPCTRSARLPVALNCYSWTDLPTCPLSLSLSMTTHCGLRTMSRTPSSRAASMARAARQYTTLKRRASLTSQALSARPTMTSMTCLQIRRAARPPLSSPSRPRSARRPGSLRWSRRRHLRRSRQRRPSAARPCRLRASRRSSPARSQRWLLPSSPALQLSFSRTICS
mmetsp:Transcript_107739/g.313585  ORF Transcript_107739/g.313585 Transcript_107739/m.313585 type:complete len:224 (+) Transcript_107739:861-1532(+)